MAGFNFEVGRSNSMVAAEGRGMVTIGRWAKRYGLSAAAAVEVMKPLEAHHTGTGWRGKSRLTPVIDSACEPTAEQLLAMRDFDAVAKPARQARWAILKEARVALEAQEKARAALEEERRAVFAPLEKRAREQAIASMPPEPVVRMHRLPGETREQMEARRGPEIMLQMKWEIEKNLRVGGLLGQDPEWRAATAKFYGPK